MKKFKQMIIDAGIEMCKKSLTVGTWGNISCRDSETGNIYVTPSGMDYDKLELDDIVVFDKDGERIEGERNPSIEAILHISIYQNRDDVNAVVHTHPTYSTVFGLVEKPIPPITEDFVQIVGKSADCAEYALPGTEELAQNTVDALADKNAVLLKNHGTVCVGPDMAFAFKICDVVEKAAYIYLLSKNLGEPRFIPDDDIKAMQEFVKNDYGQ